MDGKKKYLELDPAVRQAVYDDLKRKQDELCPYATRDQYCLRRAKENFRVQRPNFAKDCERILYCRYFNRYADKTQVFSLYKNDDITRRILHVQLVSRIARNIGRMLNLNLDLIEAISLGHDLGHTPFGHAGERFLSAIYKENTGRYFNHNVHSARILDKVLSLNLSLQVLNGILCHNGEKVSGEYRPNPYTSKDAEGMFLEFDRQMEECYTDEAATGSLVPATLEGCVVRLSDVIAYLGKDRQDAQILKIGVHEPFSENNVLGSTNSDFINNIITNVVSNSYGKPYIKLDEEYADALAYEKQVNFKRIYELQDKNEPYPTIRKMFEQVYEKLLEDFVDNNERSPIYRHHINHVFSGFSRAAALKEQYLKEEPNQVVVDYIASMTDDYFMDLYEYLFPGQQHLSYQSYFSSRNEK
ncbi:deoxyguanosinetriphosphate triphosphohydrolase family protein [Christensenella timonensis]|uniref:deoxyguanosinetriphosphate triphosphohydrolase family protein n=1 Tax=Christensenella timonensis TaxID=1816678 RepID=UPI00082CEE2D|nr:HD domain-containing protein [Christensenella timonensis]